MKNKTKTFFIILAIFSLVILGAQQQGCNKGPVGPTFNTTALTLSFIDQAPPISINLGTPFQIYLKAENYGEYDIEAGTAKFYLSQITPNLRNVNPVLSNQNKITKKTDQQEAGFEIIKFAENAEPSITITNPVNFSMKVDACYPYATSTETTICVGQGVTMCPITGEKITTGANTNAPIQITSVTEQIQGNRLYVSFMIENKGNGDAYYSNFDCDKFFGQDSSARVKEQMKKNYVDISITAENEPDFKCTNLQSESGSQIEGLQGMATVGRKVTCTKIVGQETHPAILKINMLYKYLNGITRPINILP